VRRPGGREGAAGLVREEEREGGFIGRRGRGTGAVERLEKKVGEGNEQAKGTMAIRSPGMGRRKRPRGAKKRTTAAEREGGRRGRKRARMGWWRTGELVSEGSAGVFGKRGVASVSPKPNQQRKGDAGTYRAAAERRGDAEKGRGV